MKYLSFITHAPSFEDEDKSRAATVLHFILIAITVANIAAILARPFLLEGQRLGPASANFIVLLILIGLFVLMWKGRVRLAGLILTALMWFVLASSAYAESGIMNPVFSTQTVVIVMAGLLIGEWASLGFALLTSLYGLRLVQLAEFGAYINSVGTITIQQTWLNDTTAFVLTSLLLFLSLRIIRDARNRARQQAQSRYQSDERYRSLVESAPDTIFTLDRNHIITFLNRSARGPVENFVGKMIYDFLPPDAHEAYRAAVNCVLEQGRTEQIEVQTLNPDDGAAWYSVRFSPIRENNRVVALTGISWDITEQKRAQAELRATEERYQSALDNLMEGAQIISFDWRYLYVNDVVAAQGKQPKEVLIGSKMTDLYPGIENTDMFAVLRTCMEKRTRQMIQNEFTYPDGTKAYFELSIQPVPEGIFILSLDITERKLAEAALRDSEEQYRQLFEANPQPVFVTDLKTLEFLAVNDAAVDHYGYSRDELLTMTVLDLRVDEQEVVVKQATDTYQQSSHQRSPILQHRKKDGSIIWIEIAYHRMNYQGRDAVLSAVHDLTDRLRAEQAVRESEARLKARIESAMDAIITIDEAQQIVQFNPAAEKMFRISTAEILGQPLIKLIPERFRALHASHIQSFGQTGVTNRHMGALGAISGLRATGEEFPIEASISQFDVGTGKFYTVILRDITERERAEEALRRSEELLSTIFQSVPVAITIISMKDKRILNVNDYLLKLTGYEPAEVIGRPVVDAPYWVRPGQWYELPQPVREDQMVSAVEMEWRTESGETLTMLRSAIQVNIQGEPCILGLALNISERKHAERIRLEVYKDRELLELKERFISKMSHEFRTPLSVILTGNELLRRYYDRMTSEQRQEQFASVEEQVLYAIQMLDDVLTLSKERAGKMPFNPVQMNLSAFCTRIFQQVQTADNVKHQYNFITHGDLTAVDADGRLLQHILINLLSNAIKYSPEGGTIDLDIDRDEDTAIIRVSDQGIGIPIEDQKRLFEPFYRASNTQSIQGTGLGLAIVKESVETHKGTIRCDSAPGKGTTFVIQIPICAPVESNPESPV